MKKPAQHPIAEVPRRQAKVEITIGIDLSDVWSHYCTFIRPLLTTLLWSNSLS